MPNHTGIDLDIQSVDLFDGIANLNDGRTLPVVQMFDADGDQTNDPELACSYVVDADGRLLTAPVMERDLER